MKEKVKVIIGICFVSIMSFVGIVSAQMEHEINHSFELGTEISNITYEEPDIMEEEGIFYGVVGAYTLRFPSHFVLGVDGKFAWGQVDYDSNSTGSIDDIDDWLAEVRVKGGYDLDIWDSTRLTPFAGLGYRFLRDELGGQTSTTGALGYDRESNYFYIPVGAETLTELNGGWSLGLTGEFDIFIAGIQKSELGDAIAGLDTLENDQDEGWGARGSIKLVKKSEKADWVIEPYYRYWDISQSDVQSITFSGTPIGVVGYEPDNKSMEWGVKLAVNF